MLSIDGETISTATYSYDLLDRLTSVTEGGKTTTYTYDENGNRASMSIDGVTTTYAYNDANLVTTLVNKVNNTEVSRFAYTYYLDGNQRTKTESMLGGDPATTTYIYDGVGRLTSEARGNQAIAYTYDARGNRLSMNANGVVTTYTYDANNRLMSETTDGVETVYTYDANGNLLRTNTILIADHDFEDSVCTVCGDPETYMLGDVNGDGAISLIDVLRILKMCNNTEDAAPMAMNNFADEDYLPFLYDLFGVAISPALADVDGNGVADGEDFEIVWDLLYGTEFSLYTISDKIARLAADVNNDGVIDSDDYNIVLQYTLNNSSTYPVGTIVSNTSVCVEECKEYTYNDFGQQIGYSDNTLDATYAYNPSGLRSAKTVGGCTKYFIYNGMNIVFEYEESVLDGVIYYYGLNRTHNSNGEIYVYNAHGDVVQLVENGAVTVTYTYDAFGNLIAQVGESDNPFLYCGEYFDAETQTYYLRARYYNPANGRFTQQDAWAFMDASDPLSLNLYTYCCNNPIMYVDPWGCASIPLRSTVEAANGTVEWNAATHTATICVNGKTISFSENPAEGIYINSDGRMYVPEQKYNWAVYGVVGKVEQNDNITVKGMYAGASGPSYVVTETSTSYNEGKRNKSNELISGEAEIGAVSIDISGKYAEGHVGAVSAQANVSVSVNGVSAGATASAVDGSLSLKVGIPGTDRKLKLKVSGFFLGASTEFTMTNTGGEISFGLIAGGGIGIYIE